MLCLSLIHILAPCDYEQRIELCKGVEVRFTDVGHLLGSACIEIWITEEGISRKIVFSGDVGNINQPIIKDPKQIKEADYVVMESTYGDRLHGDERPDYLGAVSYTPLDVYKRKLLHHLRVWTKG